ncbi:MAG: hypothetical protein J2P13_02250 [Acidobacteria bacterium]|nr:hypothetical protein [Acidobacteriota bacterium]
MAGATGGVYWLGRRFRRFERRRLLLNTPRSKISSAARGRVEVSGVASGPSLITSPLRQVECFYYRSLAWELRERGKNCGWVKIADESLRVPFWLDDGTGRALVDPRGAEIHVDCDWKEELCRPPLSGEPEMPGSARQFLSRHGASFSRPLRVEEYSIQPKNFLFVLGTLAENPVANPGSPVANPGAVWEPRAPVPPPAEAALDRLRGSPGAKDCEIVYLTPDAAPQSAAEMTQQQRVASALMKAGIANPTAWERTGVAHQDPVEARPYSAWLSELARDAADGKADAGPGAGGFDPHPQVVLMKGTHDSPFLISSRSPCELARSRGWKSALMV